jgi:hypothetical protein
MTLFLARCAALGAVLSLTLAGACSSSTSGLGDDGGTDASGVDAPAPSTDSAGGVDSFGPSLEASVDAVQASDSPTADAQPPGDSGGDVGSDVASDVTSDVTSDGGSDAALETGPLDGGSPDTGLSDAIVLGDGGLPDVKGPDASPLCPATVPMAGTPCPQNGLDCAYGKFRACLCESVSDSTPPTWSCIAF